jgi:large subunit ribosomal protein L4
METKIYDLQGKEKGTMNLPTIFETKISPALMHEVVVGFLSGLRSGTHSTKTRAEVSGGGRKPWKEKGTGNARAGSNRSPLWRKGGIIFGPKPRSYYQNLPQQKRRLSLQMALTAKTNEGTLMVIDSFVVAEPKTKKMVEILSNLKLVDDKVLVVVEKIDANMKMAARNVQNLVIAEAKNINTYQVLWAKKVVLTSAAVEMLNSRQKA